MGNTTGINFTLGRRLQEILMDSPDILYQINNTPLRVEQQYEIQAELPAAIDNDIIIAQVSRWIDLQQLIGKDLRIYLWCSNVEVEKYVTGICANMKHILLTVLPTYLKEEFEYDA